MRHRRRRLARGRRKRLPLVLVDAQWFPGMWAMMAPVVDHMLHVDGLDILKELVRGKCILVYPGCDGGK